MHRELVDERRWLTETQFLNALSFCMLLPGPEAMQLATYAGWKLRGTPGGLLAGLLFVLPGAAVIAALAALARIAARRSTPADPDPRPAPAAGTPAVPGRPRVATPLPPATRRASVAPWKLPAKVTMRSRPVTPRASRTADMVASVPEFTKRIFSTDGGDAFSRR